MIITDTVVDGYDFRHEVAILNEMYPISMTIYLVFIDGLKKKDGTKVLGLYKQINTIGLSGRTVAGIIYIDKSAYYPRAVSALIHEYAHCLSQQGHGFLLFELYKNWFQEEYVRRYIKYAERG